MGPFDAVPVPMMQPKDAVKYLRDRFPELVHLFSDPESLDEEIPEPYSSYERLAEEVLRRQNDQRLLGKLYSLINEMALSKERWLEEALGVSLLESLAQDAEFSANLYPHLNSQAQEMLRAIEQGMYGRSPQ